MKLYYIYAINSAITVITEEKQRWGRFNDGGRYQVALRALRSNKTFLHYSEEYFVNSALSGSFYLNDGEQAIFDLILNRESKADPQVLLRRPAAKRLVSIIAGLPKRTVDLIFGSKGKTRQFFSEHDFEQTTKKIKENLLGALDIQGELRGATSLADVMTIYQRVSNIAVIDQHRNPCLNQFAFWKSHSFTRTRMKIIQYAAERCKDLYQASWREGNQPVADSERFLSSELYNDTLKTGDPKLISYVNLIADDIPRSKSQPSAPPGGPEFCTGELSSLFAK